MYRMMDATPDELSLVRNDYSPACVFSIVWMFMGSLFAMNLFVAVIVEEFNRIKADSDGSATMTPEQMQWVVTMKAVHQRPSWNRRGRQRLHAVAVQLRHVDGLRGLHHGRDQPTSA